MDTVLLFKLNVLVKLQHMGISPRAHARLLGFWAHKNSYLHHNRSSDNVIQGSVVELVFHIKVKVVLVWADCSQQFSDVVGVQRAGLRWQTAGQVCVANMGHSLVLKPKGEKKGEYKLVNQMEDNLSFLVQYVHSPCILTALRVLWSQCCLQPLQPSPPRLSHPSCSLPSG